MLRIFKLFFCIILVNSQSLAQECFEDFMAKGDMYLKVNDFVNARNQFECAYNCPEVQSDIEKKEKARAQMNSADYKILREIFFKKQKSQLQKYLQTKEARLNPIGTLAIINHLMKSDFAQEDLLMKSIYQAWYLSHNYYSKSLINPLVNPYTKERLRAMKWEGDFIATSTQGSQNNRLSSDKSSSEQDKDIVSYVKVWDVKKGEVKHTRSEAYSIIHELIFDKSKNNAEERIIYSGYNLEEDEIFLRSWAWTYGTEDYEDIIDISDAEGIDVKGPISILDWMPGDNWLFLGDEEGFVYILDYENKILITKQQVFDETILSVSFAEMGDRIMCLVASQDGEAKILQVDSRVSEPDFVVLEPKYGKKGSLHKGNESNAHAHHAVFMDYGKGHSPIDWRVITGGCSNRLAIYDSPFGTTDNRLLSVTTDFEADISCLEVLSDGYYVAGDQAGNIKLFNKNGEVENSLSGHESKIVDIQKGPNERLIATAADNGIVRIWDREIIRQGKSPGAIPIEDGGTHSIAVSPGANFVLAGHDLHNFSNGNYASDAIEVDKHIGPDNLVALDPEGNYFLTSSGNELIQYGLDSEPQFTYEGVVDRITVLTISKNGRWIGAGTQGGSVHLWDAWTGDTVLHLEEHIGAISSLDIAQDLSLIVTASLTGELFIWNEVGQKIQTLPINSRPNSLEIVSVVQLSPDLDYLFLGYSSGFIERFKHSSESTDFVKYSQLLKGHDGVIKSLDFDPKQGYLLSASIDKTARIWDEEGTEIAVFPVQEELYGAFWTTIDNTDYLILPTKDKIIVHHRISSYSDLVERGSIEAINQNDIWEHYMEAGIEIPLETMKDVKHKSYLPKFADLFYEKSKKSFFADTAALYQAYGFYENIPIDSLDQDQIINLFDTSFRIDKQIPTIPAGEQSRGAGIYFYEQAKKAFSKIEKNRNLTLAVNYLTRGYEPRLSYEDWGIYLIDAYYSLGDTTFKFNLNSRRDILQFAQHCVSLTINSRESAISKHFLRRSISALILITRTKLKKERGKIFAALVEAKILLGEENVLQEGISRRLSMADNWEFVEYLSDRIEKLEEKESPLSDEYLLTLLKFLESVPELKSDLEMEELFARAAEILLEVGNSEKAKEVWQSGVNLNLGQKTSPHLVVVGAYISLLQGDFKDVESKMLAVAGQTTMLDDKQVSIKDMILEELDLLERNELLSDSALLITNRVREFLVFNMPFEDMIHEPETKTFYLEGLVHYKNLVENVNNYPSKVLYQERVVSIFERLRLSDLTDFKAISPVQRDSFAMEEYGRLCLFMSLSKEPENALLTLQDLKKKGLLGDEQFINRAEAVSNLMLGHFDLWQTSYDRNKNNRVNDKSLGDLYLKDLFELKKNAFMSQNLRTALTYWHKHPPESHTR